MVACAGLCRGEFEGNILQRGLKLDKSLLAQLVERVTSIGAQVLGHVYKVT